MALSPLFRADPRIQQSETYGRDLLAQALQRGQLAQYNPLGDAAKRLGLAYLGRQEMKAGEKRRVAQEQAQRAVLSQLLGTGTQLGPATPREGFQFPPGLQQPTQQATPISAEQMTASGADPLALLAFTEQQGQRRRGVEERLRAQKKRDELTAAKQTINAGRALGHSFAKMAGMPEYQDAMLMVPTLRPFVEARIKQSGEAKEVWNVGKQAFEMRTNLEIRDDGGKQYLLRKPEPEETLYLWDTKLKDWGYVTKKSIADAPFRYKQKRPSIDGSFLYDISQTRTRFVPIKEFESNTGNFLEKPPTVEDVVEVWSIEKEQNVNVSKSEATDRDRFLAKRPKPNKENEYWVTLKNGVTTVMTSDEIRKASPGTIQKYEKPPAEKPSTWQQQLNTFMPSVMEKHPNWSYARQLAEAGRMAQRVYPTEHLTPPADAAPVQESETLWELSHIPGLTGLVPEFKSGLEGTLASIEVDVEDPQVAQARQTFALSRNNLVRTLSANPRFPVAEMERLEKEINIKPGMFTSASQMRNRMIAIDQYLEQLMGTVQRKLDTGGLTATMQGQSLKLIADIQQFRALMGIPENATTGAKISGASKKPGQTWEQTGPRQWSRIPTNPN